MLKYQKVIFSFLCLLGVGICERVEIYKEGRPILFFVKQNLQASIEFPENIAQVITSYPEGTGSYSVIGNKFFFLLTGSWEGLIFIIGESGRSYPVLVKEVLDNPDIVLKIVGTPESKKMAISSVMEKALKQLLSETIQDGIEEDINQEFYRDKNIIIKGYKLFRFTTGFVGVIGEVENISKEAIVIPTTQISIPRLVAISFEKEYLNAKEKTKAYFLFKAE